MKTLRYILMALLLSSASGHAADNVVVVELFTSQGCSSCPPADENLSALADRDDVLALSMHVDYWDYLGWRDTFGNAAHTERQIGYRDAMGSRVIYTPQMVVHGTYDVPGYRPDLIVEAIGSASRHERKAEISIADEGGMLKAHVVMDGVARPCTIWIASYLTERTVEIGRGENAGERITYHNIVDKLMRVGVMQAGAATEVALPQPAAGEGVAIWIQDDETRRILTASFIEG